MNNLTEPAANIAVKTKSFKLRRKTDYGEAMNIRISEILEIQLKRHKTMEKYLTR